MRWGGNWYALGHPVRCVDGRLYRHDPQFDDPDLETDIGACPECGGAGCAEVALIEAHAETCQDCPDCGGSGVEMYVGFENSVMERPCSSCQPEEQV